MRRFALILGAALLLPQGVSAAYVNYEPSLIQSAVLSENAYLAGTEVTVTAPIEKDISVFGGTVLISSPTKGDALLGGGTLNLRAPVIGDVRAAAVRLFATEPISGDLFAVASHADITGMIGEGLLLGSTVQVLGGAEGPVTIYGSKVTLKGTFAKDVRVVATNSLTVEEGTSIGGTLKYNAPQEARIAEGTVVTGGIEYTGKTFLPTEHEARLFAFFGAGIFLLVRLFAVLIAVGLLAGLFPRFVVAVADETVRKPLSSFILTALLGFSVIVATPILVLLLLISFAGAGVGFVIAAGYVLLVLVGYLLAGAIAGIVLARRVLKREHFTWRHAVLGTAVLYVIGTVPFLGMLVTLVLLCAAVGGISTLVYHLAFTRHEETGE